MIKRIFVICSITLSSLAHADWVCPNSSEPQTVDGLSVTSSYYQPRIHFKGQAPNNWTYLQYYYGVNTDYGKATLAIAMVAYAFGSQVRVVCSGQNVYHLIISDQGGTPPD